MKTLVIIVCYRVVDLTIACLRSLVPEVLGTPGVSVVVCENGTGGDAAERLRRAIDEGGWGGWCDLVAISPNRGFTGGNNHVLRAAMSSDSPPDYVLLLNADTIVLTGAVRELVAFMNDHPSVGIAGSRLEGEDGRVHGSAFGDFNALAEFDKGLRLGVVSRLLRRWAVSRPPPSGACKVDWVSGASMMIRREVLQQVGLLDEGLYTYFDDADYCLNARRAGWPAWYVPASRVIHLEGSSTGIASSRRSGKRRPSYWFEARRRFYIKNYGPLKAALADAAFISGRAAGRVRGWVQRRPNLDPPHFLRDSIRHSVFVAGPRLNVVRNPALDSEPAAVNDPVAAGTAGAAESRLGRSSAGATP